MFLSTNKTFHVVMKKFYHNGQHAIIPSKNAFASLLGNEAISKENTLLHLIRMSAYRLVLSHSLKNGLLNLYSVWC